MRGRAAEVEDAGASRGRSWSAIREPYFHADAARDVAKLVKDLDGIVKQLTKFAIKLTPEERRGTLKFRRGGEHVVELVARLARKYKVDDADTPVDDMLSDLALASRLAPLATVTELIRQYVDDTLLQAQSEAWQAATALYSQLAVRARNNPDLAAEFAEAKAFFARRHRAPSTPGTPSSPNG